MSDLISVIIPSYNHSKYVRDTIESIVFQTYKNLELIIIDDNSQDNSAEIIEKAKKKHAQRFVNFQFVKKECNKGIVDSLNLAVDMSEGKFLYIIASDDIAKPDAIKTLYEFIKDKDEYALVTGDNEIIDENNAQVFWDINYRSYKKYDPIKAKFKSMAQRSKLITKMDYESEQYGSYESILRCNYITNGYLLRKSAVVEVGKYKENVFEDWYMNLQLSKKFKLKFLDKVLFSYRWHSENTIKNNYFSAPLKYTTLLNEKNYCFENNLQNVWEEVFSIFEEGEQEKKLRDKFLSNESFVQENPELFMLIVRTIIEKNHERKNHN